MQFPEQRCFLFQMSLKEKYSGLLLTSGNLNNYEHLALEQTEDSLSTLSSLPTTTTNTTKNLTTNYRSNRSQLFYKIHYFEKFYMILILEMELLS